MAKPIKIVITGDDKGFQRTMGKVEGTLSGFGKKAGAAAAALGGALAAAGVAKFGKDAVTLASDLEEAASAAETVFGQAFADVETALKDSASAMGLNRAEAFDLANGIGVLFKNVNDAERATIALDLAARAADIGSMFNTNPDEAAAALTSALNGSSETVRRFGIDTSDAAIKQFALQNGIEAVGGQLTEDQKKMIRYQIIMRDSSIAAGNFADTSDGLANQQRILEAQFEELQIRLGEKLLPIVVKVAQFLIDDFLPNAERLGRYLIDTFGPAFTAIAGFIRDDLIPMFRNVGGTMDGEVSPIVRSLRDLFNNGLKPAFQAISDFVRQDLIPIIDRLATLFRERIWPILENFVIPVLVRLWSFLAGSILPILLEVVGVILNSVITALERFFDSLDLLVGFVQDVIDIFDDLIDTISELPGRIADAARGLWDGIPRPPSFISDGIGGVFGGLGRLNPFATGVASAPGGLALVGERGPEIVQLPRGSRVTPNHELDRSGGFGNIMVNVQSQADPWQIGREVAWAIRTGV